MEIHQVKINIPLNWHYTEYFAVVDYLREHGSIVHQTKSSPYNWFNQWCNQKLKTSYQINGLEVEVILEDTEIHDVDARQGNLKSSKLVVSGADKKSIDEFVDKINVLISQK